MVMGFLMGMVLAIPIILPPIVFVWWVNSGGFMGAVKTARMKKAPQTQKI
ncbi:MAG: hypothetical protein Q8O43_05905 [Dehalococcoidia bacterium]|nr:hypothetical protein [Dehalococcoidia bacterium]